LGNNKSTFRNGQCLHGVPHAAVSLLYRPMSEHEVHYNNIHYPCVTQKFEFPPPKLSQHYTPCAFYKHTVGLWCPESISQNVYMTWVTSYCAEVQAKSFNIIQVNHSVHRVL
jgi:hypothetical protein